MGLASQAPRRSPLASSSVKIRHLEILMHEQKAHNFILHTGPTNHVQSSHPLVPGTPKCLFLPLGAAAVSPALGRAPAFRGGPHPPPPAHFPPLLSPPDTLRLTPAPITPGSAEFQTVPGTERALQRTRAEPVSREPQQLSVPELRFCLWPKSGGCGRLESAAHRKS